MKNALFTFLPILVIFCACSKNSDKNTGTTDPYSGTYHLKFTVNGPWFLYNSLSGFPALTKTAEAWIIHQESNGQYSIKTTTGPNLNAVFYNTTRSVVLIQQASPILNEQLFTFEKVNGSNLVNIKSLLDNKYVVIHYGLDASGNINRWEISVDDKASPCTADFSGSYPTPVSTGCQFDFELVKQ
jgi:hypothetical protein